MERANLENVETELTQIQIKHFQQTETKPRKRQMGMTKQEHNQEKTLIRNKNLRGNKIKVKTAQIQNWETRQRIRNFLTVWGIWEKFRLGLQ